MKHPECRFTLVELLVVIAVIDYRAVVACEDDQCIVQVPLAFKIGDHFPDTPISLDNGIPSRT